MITRSAFLTRARASANRCHWPALGSMPGCSQRPSGVARPCGQAAATPAMSARRAASATRGSSGRPRGSPIQMFSAAVNW